MKPFLASSVTRAVVFAIVCTPALSISAQSLPDLPKAGQAIDNLKALAAKPTPKTEDGHPDLRGRWMLPYTGGDISFGGRVEGNTYDLFYGTPNGQDPETSAITTDSGRRRDAARRRPKNVPSYKPEFLAKVEMMAKDANHYDPTKYTCLQPGVPRLGAPRMILTAPGQMIFLYAGGYNAPNPYSTYRVIPVGQAHRTTADVDPTPMGDPVGHWEGNTLVIETVGFDDSTWFGNDGYFHSDAMRVIERITRKGDTLEYSATVEDPQVLTKPYNMNPTPLILKRGGPKDVLFNDDLPCDITNPAHDFRSHADHGEIVETDPAPAK